MLRHCHSIYVVRMEKPMHTLVGIAYFQSKAWTHGFSNPANHDMIWGNFYKGDWKTKICDVNHLLTSLWMEYRHNLYSPNITSELGTLSKYVWDSAGRCCNSVPRSGLKVTYIFFCAFVVTTTCQHAFTLYNGIWHLSLSCRMERVWNGTGTETAWRFGWFDQIMILNTATMRDDLIICTFRATL